MDFTLIKFVPQDLFILVVACSTLGFFFKSNKLIPDKFIPVLLLVFACVGSCLILKNFNIIPVLQGICAWGISVGVSQLHIQGQKIESQPRNVEPILFDDPVAEDKAFIDADTTLHK